MSLTSGGPRIPILVKLYYREHAICGRISKSLKESTYLELLSWREGFQIGGTTRVLGSGLPDIVGGILVGRNVLKLPIASHPQMRSHSSRPIPGL